MARIFKNIRAYLGRYDVSGTSNKCALDYSVEEKDSSHLLTSTMLTFPGLMKTGVQLDGMMTIGDPSTNDYVEAIINSQLGSLTNVPFVGVVGSNSSGAAGDPAFFFRSILVKGDPLSGGVGDLHAFSLKLPPAASRLVSGKVGLIGLQTGPSDPPAFNLGVVGSTQKLYAAISVQARNGGAAPVVVTVKSGASNGGAGTNTRITFADVPVALNGRMEDWKEVAGPITDTWFEVDYAGDQTNFTAIVVIGIGPA